MSESKIVHVKSSSGCVHAVDDYTYVSRCLAPKTYRTVCNHQSHSSFLKHGDGYYHAWEETTEEITCKRCLKVLGKLKPPVTQVAVYIEDGVVQSAFSGDPNIEVTTFDFDGLDNKMQNELEERYDAFIELMGGVPILNG